MSNTNTATKSQLIKFHQHIRIFKLNEGVLKVNRLTKSEIKIYGYIYGWCKDTGLCVDSFTSISSSCEVARSTAELSIKRLEKLGWIAVIHGARIHGGAKNQCNQYQILKTPLLKTGNKQVKKKSLADYKTETDKRLSKIFVIDKLLAEVGCLSPERIEIINKLRYAN